MCFYICRLSAAVGNIAIAPLSAVTFSVWASLQGIQTQQRIDLTTFLLHQ